MIDGFRTADLVDALAWAPPVRRYTSLVPTQLATVLDDPEATEALGTFDGVLVGGAATAPALLERARAAGVAVRTTYGMSETAGGCVYDGVPLEDTAVTIGDDGRVGLSGPTVASGYLGESDRTAAVFDTDPTTGARRFWTDDVGELRDGVLHVVGRRDDLITTGGLKVAPAWSRRRPSGCPGCATPSRSRHRTSAGGRRSASRWSPPRSRPSRRSGPACASCCRRTPSPPACSCSTPSPRAARASPTARRSRPCPGGRIRGRPRRERCAWDGC
ncbi:hypothetical protein GCM10025872_03870 [Barrientosiimonas endolithica]|uniref:AMP-dependent synthetase/ligase domain-containing protein n=1 Tax=Barrientosiimonas endolithica TaxID=1535208 RepID=A0ABN6YKU1_9MICO|nr:hypothetical protein GCM10025872_03870 [Barrientosiimonas endolithica]